MDVQLDDIDAQIIQFFAEKGPLAMNKLAARSGAEDSLCQALFCQKIK